MFTTRIVAPIILSTLLGFARDKGLLPVSIKVRTAGPTVSVVAEFIAPFGTVITMLDSVEILPGVHAVVVSFVTTLEDDTGRILDTDVKTSVSILAL